MKRSTKKTLATIGGSAAFAAGGYFIAPMVQPYVPLPLAPMQFRIAAAAAAGVGFYFFIATADGFLTMVGVNA